MSRYMSQIYFELYEFDVNVVLILIATCSYKSTLYVGSTNESEQLNFNIVDSLIPMSNYE